MNHPNVKQEKLNKDLKLDMYVQAYDLVWSELRELKKALGIDPIKLVTSDQYAKIKKLMKEGDL